MSVPPGLYRLRYLPDWQQPPPGVGGEYATYNRGPFVTAESEGPGAQGSQVWEVRGHENDTIVISTPRLGGDHQYWHNRNTENNQPIFLGLPKPFTATRNQEITDFIICKIVPIDAPIRLGVTFCVGISEDESGVPRVATRIFEEVSGIPGWQLIPAGAP